MSVPSEAVRHQLERVLASETFANAGRHSRLLRYLVERTLDGAGDQLKEYVLGTEVFDRADTYDPRVDSIVRVEVRRLRRRLEDYYGGAGSGDPLVIAIPRGRYVPEFIEQTGDGGAGHSRNPGAAGVRLRVAAALAAAAVAGLGVAALIFVRALPGSGVPPKKPAIAVLPFEHYSTSDEDAALAARVTDAVAAELARAGTVLVASRTSALRFAGTPRSLPDIGRALNVDFAIEASAVVSGGRLTVVARLVDVVRDRKVWVAEYTFGADEIPGVSRTIATEAAAGALAYRRRAAGPPVPDP